MTVDEFLIWAEDKDGRWELFDGVPFNGYGMAPPHPVHGEIQGNCAAAIRSRLPKHCRVMTEAGIRDARDNSSFMIADVAVSGSPRSEDSASNVADPKLVIEVLSKTTRDGDILGKLPRYREIDSIEAIMLIETTTRQVDLWRRQDGAWQAHMATGAEAITPPLCSGPIPLDEIFGEMDLG